MKWLQRWRRGQELALLAEAEGILWDVLASGAWAKAVSRGQYMGVLSAKLKERRGRVRFVVTLYDTGNLNRFPGPFTRKYGSRYDPRREGYSIPTDKSIKAAPADRRRLEGELLGRMAQDPRVQVRADGRMVDTGAK